jgi:hypothetical protein
MANLEIAIERLRTQLAEATGRSAKALAIQSARCAALECNVAALEGLAATMMALLEAGKFTDALMEIRAFQDRRATRVN